MTKAYDIESTLALAIDKSKHKSSSAYLVQIPNGIDEEGSVEREQGDKGGDGI
jgi:hypothetical protein